MFVNILLVTNLFFLDKGADVKENVIVVESDKDGDDNEPLTVISGMIDNMAGGGGLFFLISEEGESVSVNITDETELVIDRNERKVAVSYLPQFVGQKARIYFDIPLDAARPNVDTSVSAKRIVIVYD